MDAQRVEGKDYMTYRWAKKIVDKNDPHGIGYYHKHIDYYVLTSQGSAAVVAFKFVLDRPKPHHIDFCTDAEVEKLESWGTHRTVREDKPFYEDYKNAAAGDA